MDAVGFLTREGPRLENLELQRDHRPNLLFEFAQSLRAVIGTSAVSAAATAIAFAAENVASNRYLALGMDGAAIYSTAVLFNATFLRFSFILAALLSALAAIHAALRWISPGHAALWVFRLAIASIALWLLICAVSWLRTLDWVPPALSLLGILFYGGLFAGIALIGASALWMSSALLGAVEAVASRLRSLWCLLAALALLLMVNAAAIAHRSLHYKDGPNVLFITVDTLRADHLGIYGYARDTSPNLDRLGKEGILFSNAAVQWPKTSPSFASMMTGLYGYQTGVKRYAGQTIRDHFVLLSEVLLNDQYNTAGVVTNGNLAKAFGFAQGFETYVEMWQQPGGARSGDAEFVTDQVIRWLDSNAADGKFFFWAHYSDPHALYEPPGEYNEIFVGDEFYDTERRVDLLPAGAGDMGGIPERARLGDERLVDYYVAQYDAEIRYMDEQIGVLLAHLSALGLRENTIVVFTADHGESLGDHDYFFEHGLLPYDDCVRAPLIMRIPGRAVAGQKVDAAVELIAVVPTLLELLGLPATVPLSAQSLLKLGRGDDRSPKFAFTESGYSDAYQRQVRSGSWKLIYLPSSDDRALATGQELELYNLETDPNELTNLADAEPAKMRELKDVLFEWIARSEQDLVTGDEGESVELDDATKANLRELGYLE